MYSLDNNGCKLYFNVSNYLVPGHVILILILILIIVKMYETKELLGQCEAIHEAVMALTDDVMFHISSVTQRLIYLKI